MNNGKIWVTQHYDFFENIKVVHSYAVIEKGKISNGYATKQTILTIAACAGGGYCVFMGNIIIKIINTKSAISGLFAISTMFTFHKHTPFHRLGILSLPVNIKVWT